jgi:hypothetical protein
MISFSGKISTFGGSSDLFMKPTEGLALFEHHEADKRPDLFCEAEFDRSDFPVWKRLRETSMYCAFRYNQSIPRRVLQETPVKIINPKNSKFVMASIVDWGPNEDTHRMIDVSEGVANALDLETDDIANVEIEFRINDFL